MLFRHLTQWADMLSLPAGLVYTLYTCVYSEINPSCLLGGIRGILPVISGCFQSCSLGRVLQVLLPGQGCRLRVSAPSRSAQVLLYRGLPFRWGASYNPSLPLDVELK